MKNIFTVLLVFTCCQLFVIKVNAAKQNTYKTVTNSNIIYIVDDGGEFSYYWQFDKEDYRDKIDFSLNIDTNSNKLSQIQKFVYDNSKVKYLSFEHHGALPSDATLKVKVSDKYSDGDKLYLYYYNEESGKLEYIDRNLIVKNGLVEFQIKHCSDYILTASIVKTAVNNPQSMTLIIISLLILGVILVAATLFMNSKK